MPSDTPLVLLAGSINIVFDRVEQGLRQAECEIIRFHDPARFLADPEALSRAAVFYGEGSIPITRERMAAAPELRAIISPYTGTEGFDEAAASELGILVGNGQIRENYESMAEATILMVLACLYDLAGKDRRLRANAWANPISARMLGGKTVGLLGFGRIARAIAERLAGWDVTLLSHTPLPPAAPGITFVDLGELLRASDVLCVLAPLNEGTRNLLDARRLASMKPGAVLVATSRGGIVDEAALVELARAGRFLRIGLDVFAEEPLSADSPLRQLHNAILTPHSIGHTEEIVRRLPEAGVESIVRVLHGEPPLHVRNPDVVPRWRARWSSGH